MAIDPICNMTVDEATARSAKRDGQTFYFCSEHCRQKFLDEGLPVETPHHEHDHTKCEPPQSTQKNVTGKYICPMHSGVVRRFRKLPTPFPDISCPPW